MKHKRHDILKLTITTAALSSSTVDTPNSLKRNFLYSALSRNMSADDPLSPQTTCGVVGKQKVSLHLSSLTCRNFTNQYVVISRAQKYICCTVMLLIYFASLTLSCSAILNHAESTGSQKTSSIGLPTEYSSSFLNFRDPSRFSPPFGVLYSPKLSSADDSFGDLNFCNNQDTRNHAKGLSLLNCAQTTLKL